MLKIKITLLIAIVLISLGCANKVSMQKTLTIKVTPPEDYSSTDSISVVGSFNDWALDGPKAYELKANNGILTAKVPINEENIFFTFVKNKDWNFMPANEKGKSECAFIYRAKGKNDRIDVHIPLWMGDKPILEANHTLTGNIEHHQDFDMPQLSRKGNLSVYLPKSYRQNINKHYPVLYMLDGQNIFDEYSAHSDEWRIDEQLEDLVSKGLLQEMIVVSVPNGEQRWAEYNPWDFRGEDGTLRKGKGKLTIDFIKNQLKPFVDKTYRTQPAAEFTGLAGSSLGGLMALYAAIEHSDTFGFVAAFSPSLAIQNMAGNSVVFEAIKQQKIIGKSKIYFDMGMVEFGNYENIEHLNNLLLSRGYKSENIKMVRDDLGRHCELDWSKRFPDAIKWLTLTM